MVGKSQQYLARQYYFPIWGDVAGESLAGEFIVVFLHPSTNENNQGGNHFSGVETEWKQANSGVHGSLGYVFSFQHIIRLIDGPSDSVSKEEVCIQSYFPTSDVQVFLHRTHQRTHKITPNGYKHWYGSSLDPSPL